MDEYYFEQEYTNEELEYEFHRLMGLAEAYTGAEALRQRLPVGDLPKALEMLRRFVEQERSLRESQLVPYTLEDMRRKIQQAIAKDEYYQRLQPKSESDKTGN